jgi:GcrA cell cycle regulator
MSLMEAPARRAPRNDPDNPWTDARIAELKRRWAEGESALQIAAALDYPFTRSAILGKVHRLGLSAQTDMTKHSRGVCDYRPDSFHRKPFKHSNVRPQLILKSYGTFTPTCSPVERPATACALTDLDRGMCRFPFSDPGSADFAFCGQPTSDPTFGAYCAGHCAIAYAPRGKRTA